MHVEDAGQGEPVFLLHSSGLSGRQWKRLSQELAKRQMRAVAPHLTGQGASTPWLEPEAFDFRIDVERALALVRQTGPAHVVGHSYGGLLAVQLARAAPELVRSLSLFDPVAFGALDPAADADVWRELSAVDFSWGPDAAGRERWLTTFVDFWGGSGAWSALREEARGEFRRVGWVVKEGVRSLFEDRTPASAYAGFRFPVHLLTGELSPRPAHRILDRLREAIPGARITSVPKAGHLAPVTHAEAVNRVLLGVLAPSDGQGQGG